MREFNPRRKALWLLAALWITPAQASLLVHEGFAYGPAGAALLGANGGTGFSGAWQTAPGPANINTNYVLTSGTLGAGGSLSSASVNAIGGLARPLSQTFGADGTTMYMSMLMRAEGTLNEGYSFGFFGVFLESSGTHVYVGKPGGGLYGNWGLENQGGSGQVTTGVPIVVDQPMLLVLRADFQAGPDQFTLYLNPVSGGPEPLTGTVKTGVDAGTITGLEIFSSGAFSVDEIRIGDTYADVNGIPEPGTFAGVLGALAGLVAWRRRPGRAAC